MYYSKDKICEAFMNNLLLEDIDYKDLIAQVDDGESDIDTINYFKDQIKHDKHLPILLNLDKVVIDGNHRLKHIKN